MVAEKSSLVGVGLEVQLLVNGPIADVQSLAYRYWQTLRLNARRKELYHRSLTLHLLLTFFEVSSSFSDIQDLAQRSSVNVFQTVSYHQYKILARKEVRTSQSIV